jgi:arabinogalactan oligomer/maltooligosaccharide transport system substrate-binding protein
MKKLSLVAVLMLVAIGASSLVSVSAQDVNLIYWDTMNDQERPVMQGMIDACADELGYGVQVEYVPFSDAQSKYRTAAQAGNAPDILRTEIAWGPEFAAAGYLFDLSELVTEEEAATYLAAPFAYNTWNDGVWGLPQVTDAPALLYNKALFEEAGLDPETPPATMDELKAAAIAISELDGEGGIYGLVQPWDAYPFQAYMWAFGGGLITDEGEILINTQGTVDALNFVLGLMADGAMDPVYDPANQYGNSMTAFKEGNGGMIFMGPWATSDVLSGPAFEDAANLGVAPIPAGPAGQGSPVGGHGYTIYAGSPFPEESLELIRCLNRPENQVTLATELNLVPTVIAAYEDPALQENAILQGFLAQMEVATNRPVIPAGGQIYTDFVPAYQSVILGEADPQEAMDSVAVAWEALLAE